MNEILIEWDNTINLSNKKYLSSEISTTIKEVYKNEKLQELNLTAKEWIIYEIDKCKRAIEKNKKALISRKQLKQDIEELEQLDKYFNKHITSIDILGLNTFDNEEYNKSLNSNYKEIKKLIKAKLKNQVKYLDNITKQEVDIKRICLENIKLILKKENVKKYANSADTLLSINNISLGKNNKQNIYFVDGYHQNNMEFFIKKHTQKTHF